MHGVNVRALLGTKVLIRCLPAFPDTIIVIGSRLEKEAVIVSVIEQGSPNGLTCGFLDFGGLVHVDGCLVQFATWSCPKFLV